MFKLSIVYIQICQPLLEVLGVRVQHSPQAQAASFTESELQVEGPPHS